LLPRTTLILTLGLASQSVKAADTGAALSAIADTADRICGIVATQGEANGTKVTGDVHAELAGLAKRLASLGISGTGDIASSKYQGLLQQDLPNTLRELRACKLQVLERLQAALLPGGVAQQPGPGTPSPDFLRSPSSATVLDTTKSMTNQEEYGLYSCTSSPNTITCYLVVSRIAAGQGDYTIQRLPLQQTKMIDNFHVEHRLRRAFFIDGLGGHQQGTNLSTGESIWLALEFEATSNAVSSARIVFSPYGVNQLQGPVHNS
jgi:hypothetical protein